MKKPLILLLVVLLIFSMTACGSDSSAGQVIAYDIPAAVKNLDPQFATSDTARMIISNTFEGLFRQLPSGKVENCLAASYEVSPDKLTYTFHLRDDASWSNGDPVTAMDFEFALRRMFDSAAFSPYASQFSAIENAGLILSGGADQSALGVSATDSRTLIIRLERPDHLLLERLASSYAVPCNKLFFESTSARYGLAKETMIFNGPYVVRTWSDNAVALRQNTQYSDMDSVIAAGANLYIPSSDKDQPTEPLSRFLSGETDACKIDYQSLSKVLDKKGSYTSFEDTVWILVLNCGSPRLSNPDIRRALSYTVDRTLFEQYLPGNLHTTSMLIPPAVSFAGSSFRESAGNVSPVLPSPEIGKRYYDAGLAALGLNRLSLNELLVCDENSIPLLTGFLQQAWQKNLGLYTGIVKLSREDLLSRVSGGDFEAAVLPVSASYSSPDAILSAFTSDSPQNYAAYRSDSYNELLQSTATMDSDDQFTAYMQAEQQLLEECVVIPLFFETSYYAMAKGVSDIEFSPFLSGIYFRNARKG